jgi:hypothetical protein
MYSGFILTSIFFKYVLEWINNDSKYLKLTSIINWSPFIHGEDAFIMFMQIGNRKAWLDPKALSKIHEEISMFLLKIQVIQIIWTEYTFERDNHEWQNLGPLYFNNISKWDFQHIEKKRSELLLQQNIRYSISP